MNEEEPSFEQMEKLTFLTRINKQLCSQMNKCTTCKNLYKQANFNQLPSVVNDNIKSFLMCVECAKFKKVIDEEVDNMNDEVLKYFTLLIDFPSYEKALRQICSRKLRKSIKDAYTLEFHIALQNIYDSRFKETPECGILDDDLVYIYLHHLFPLLVKSSKYRYIKIHDVAIHSAMMGNITNKLNKQTQ